MKPHHRRLGDRLIEAGLINQQQLDQAMAGQRRTGKLLDGTLVHMGVPGWSFCPYCGAESHHAERAGAAGDGPPQIRERRRGPRRASVDAPRRKAS